MSGTNVTLQNITVTNNTSYDNYVPGGGIQIASIRASPVKVTRCTIVGNYATQGGGGIEVDSQAGYGTPVVIEYCDILQNRSIGVGGYAAGGGVGVGDASSGQYTQVLLANCRIKGNTGRIGGGVFASCYLGGPRFNVAIFGCDIEGNRQIDSNSTGTGIFLGNNVNYSVANSTIVDNVNTQAVANPGIYVGRGSWGANSRTRFINSVIAGNNGFHCDGYQDGYGALGRANIDFQRTSIALTSYREQESVSGTFTFNMTSPLGPMLQAQRVPPLVTVYPPYFHSLNDIGGVSQAIEQNLDGDPSFAGAGSHPYQLTLGSNSRDNGLARYTNGFYYVDMNCNAIYNGMVDIVVGGAAPSTVSNLVYTADLLGNPRIMGSGIDRGAYELKPPGGLMTMFR